MTWLSEDPWPLFWVLVAVAGVFLVTLRVTQQGKYLVWAGALVGAALALLAVEHFWVTDNERIEAVVYDIADAVKRSDPTAIERHLAPEFDKQVGPITKALIRGRLEGTTFDFVSISKLDVSHGRQTRMGSAQFIVRASWKETRASGSPDFNATPPAGTGWSLGFRETEPRVWKVTRIEPVGTIGGVDVNTAMKYINR